MENKQKIAGYVTALKEIISQIPALITSVNDVTPKLINELNNLINKISLIQLDAVLFMRITYNDEIEQNKRSLDQFNNIVKSMSSVIDLRATVNNSLQTCIKGIRKNKKSVHTDFDDLMTAITNNNMCNNINVLINSINHNMNLAIFAFKVAEKNLFAENTDGRMHM
jgi:uncharacterized protein YllA (UPF0747 family)